MLKIDMEMPESCYECRFNATGCAAMGRRFEHPLHDEDDEQYDYAKYIEHRMSWCPLKKSLTVKELIRKVYSIIVIHGQQDSRFTWGDRIMYSPSEIEKILTAHADELD